MKAMAATQHGGPDALALIDLPDPAPGPKDLILKVHASAMNPVDWKVRAGAFPDRTFPLVMGYDVAGEVVAKGPTVQGFEVGDAVYASPSIARPGSNAELVALDYRTAALKPSQLSWEQAAALPLVTLTSWESLHDRARMQPGQSVLILGGAGGTGHVAIQIARAMHGKVIATASRPETLKLCTDLGADHVLNYKEVDVPEAVKDLTDGRGVDIAYDTVGGQPFLDAMESLAPGGQLVEIASVPAEADVNRLKYRSCTLHMEFMGLRPMFDLAPERHGQILAEARDLVEKGLLRPVIHETAPLRDLARVHADQESGQTIGKRVLRPEF